MPGVHCSCTCCLLGKKIRDKLCVAYRAPCCTTLFFKSSSCYLYGTTQHSGHQVQHQCYLWYAMPCQCSPGDPQQVLWIWESTFYSQSFFTWHSFLLFQGFPGASSSTSKLAELQSDLRNIAPARLFVWITAIHKRYICGRFYLRARTGQSRNINLHEELVLQNISFEIFASYGIWTLFAIGEHVTRLFS